MIMRPKLQLLVTAAAFLAVSSVAHAQATRTWVSGVGDDANPCSRTAPCKTFAGAISKTAASGEINVLDPGGFGGVTITKAITISSEGFEAGVLVSGTNAIIINAGANDNIVLRGLDIEGLNTGLNGIRFLAGANLYVQNCTIRNFTQAGIDFEPAAASNLFVDDTLITHNGGGAVGGGILIKPTVTGNARAQIHNTRMEVNRFGLQVEARGNATVTQSVASRNTLHNYGAISTTQAAVLALDDSPATHGVNDGVVGDGVAAFVRISNMLIFANNVGVRQANSASVVSFGNNRILGNLTAQTQGTITPQAQQ